MEIAADMSDQRARSMLQENVVSLYLRLNGFFVTEFVVHSPDHGKNRTQIDALALRMPFSAEPERQIGPDPILDLSERYTELAVCEVKSKSQKKCFNDSLLRDPAAIATVFRWSGLLGPKEVDVIADKFVASAGPKGSVLPNRPTVIGPRNIRIRGLLFGPENKARRSAQPFFVTGTEIFDYVRKCLRPDDQRPTCATTYDLQVWGRFEKIVKYFKLADDRYSNDFSSLRLFVDK